MCLDTSFDLKAAPQNTLETHLAEVGTHHSTPLASLEPKQRFLSISAATVHGDNNEKGGNYIQSCETQAERGPELGTCPALWVVPQAGFSFSGRRSQ